MIIKIILFEQPSVVVVWLVCFPRTAFWTKNFSGINLDISRPQEGLDADHLRSASCKATQKTGNSLNLGTGQFIALSAEVEIINSITPSFTAPLIAEREECCGTTDSHWRNGRSFVLHLKHIKFCTQKQFKNNWRHLWWMERCKFAHSSALLDLTVRFGRRSAYWGEGLMFGWVSFVWHPSRHFSMDSFANQTLRGIQWIHRSLKEEGGLSHYDVRSKESNKTLSVQRLFLVPSDSIRSSLSGIFHKSTIH